MLTLSLAVFVALARTKSGDYEGSELSAVAVAATCAVLVGTCLLASRQFSDWRRAILLAIGVGMLFGVVAVLTKIVMHILTAEDLTQVFSSPVTYLLIVVGVGATLLQQAAFHAGSLQASVPAMLVLEPVVAVLLGQVVLGEHIEVSRHSAIALGLAMTAMVAATIALGRDEGAYEEELEAAASRRTT